MVDKITITYIGPKSEKKDTITGSRIVFPRYKPVDVESDKAYTLLGFPTVFIEHKDLEEHLGSVQAQGKLSQAEAERLAQLAAEEAAANDMTVTVGEEVIDLSKLTSVKLKTLVESLDLDLKQGAQEKVAEFALRVRDAIRNTKAE
jgi:hypothetical protein